MIEFLSGFDFWYWWILALVLFVIELALPGIVFLWLAIAAAVTGVVAWIAPGLGWQLDFALFAVLSVIAIFVGRKVWRPDSVEVSDPTLNRRGEQYIGRTFALETAIENGTGRVHVGDTSWLARGPDMPAGSKVKVTSAEGSVLVVEAA